MTDDAQGIRWMFHATALGASYEDLLESLARLSAVASSTTHFTDGKDHAADAARVM
jgi:hypothetical protein